MFNQQENKEKFLASTIEPKPQKKKKNSWNIVLVSGVLIVLGILTSVIWVKLQQTAIKANAAKSRALLSKDPIDALVLAIHTTGQNKRLTRILPGAQILTPVQVSLRQAIDTAEKSHLFQHEDSVHSVSFQSHDRQVIVSSDGNGVQLWSGTGKPITKILPNENVTLVTSSPDGQTIAIVIDSQAIRLLDRGGNYLETFLVKKSQVTSLVFSPDSKFIVSGNQDNVLRVWDLEGNLILTLRGHESAIDAVTFSPDGKYILSGSHNDGTVRLWNLNGKLLQSFSIGKNMLTAIAISPDGKTIIVGDKDGKIRLWDIDGNLVKTLSGHSNNVSSIIFNPDGQTFISSSLDKTIRLWSKNGSLLRTLQGHEEEVHSVAFSSDGKKIISGSKDGKVLLWIGGNWEDWLREGCYQLKNHPILKNPQTKEAKGAKRTCQPYKSKSQNLAQSDLKRSATNDTPETKSSPVTKKPPIADTPETKSSPVTKKPPIADTPENKSSPVTKKPPVADTPEITQVSKVTKKPKVTPEDFQPPKETTAKHYHHRGSDRADLKLIEKFTKIVNNPAASTVQKTNAYINRGVIYFRDEKYEQAIDSYTKAVKNASEQQLVHIYVNRGIAYSSLLEPKHELAIEDYNQAINLDPQYFDAYVERGIAFSSLGQYPQAIEDYTKAIAINPNNPDVYYAQGFTLALQKGKQKEARESYRQAANLYDRQGKKEYARSARKKIEELSE